MTTIKAVEDPAMTDKWRVIVDARCDTEEIAKDLEARLQVVCDQFNRDMGIE